MATELNSAPEELDPQLVLQRMDEAFYFIDRDWRFRFVNPQAEAFWGLPRAELIGHTMMSLFPHFAGSPSHAAHQTAMETQSPQTIETISTATGAPVEIRLFPSATGLSVYFRDVTERRELERTLETREELLGLAETSAGIGVWVQDLSTSTMTGTPQFYHLLGVEPPIGPVPQDYARSFRHPDDRERVTSGFRAALESGADVFESEYRIIRPSGEVRWIFGRGKVTRDKEGRPWRYSGVDLDITERRNQDEHLRVVVRELQHRTNNLLTIVQSLAQQTARGSSDLASFVPTFTSRLRGLSQSGALLARQQWRGAMLDELVISHVEPLAPVERFDISGPATLLTPRAAQNLGLALHELATNATKHGALSVPAGRVSVHWAVASDGALKLKWQETGGPPVSAPKRKGFGRVLMEEIVASAIGAKVDAQFLMDGFAWSIAIPSAEYGLEEFASGATAPSDETAST